MLVLPEKKALVLRLRDPSVVTNVIPSAKRIVVKDKEFVAVPHGVLETRVLANLGLDPPAPIRSQYSWPGRYKPFQAQRDAAAFLSLHHRAFNLSEIGTGKSLSALWAYDYLRESGQANKLLVIAPLSTLERTWADEVFQHFSHLTCAVLHGTRDRRLKLLETDVDIYIINHDGVKVVEPALRDREDIDLVVIDEIAQVARNRRTDRWKVLNSVVNGHKKSRSAWGMTGTPTPNEPLDAWAQCRLIVPKNVTPYQTKFRDMVMRKFGPFTWLPRSNATEIVHSVMSPAVRFTRDECLDLPPIMFETRHVGLSKAQAKAYKQMMNELHAEIDSGAVTAVNAAVKMSKLVQIACGIAYGDSGEELHLDPADRVAEVKDIITSAEGKVIVFAPFVATVEMLHKTLNHGGKNVAAMIHGGVGKSQRDQIFHDFQRAPDPRVLVAQPAAMSHGLTLTAASTIVWYAPTTSNETFEQANGRINRPGQKMNNFIIMLEGSPIERRIYQRLENKQKVQNTLLDIVKEERGGHIR